MTKVNLRICTYYIILQCRIITFSTSKLSREPVQMKQKRLSQSFQFPQRPANIVRGKLLFFVYAPERSKQHCHKRIVTMFTPHQEDTNSSTKCLWYLHFEFYLTFDHIS